jgi:hypothetical protein
MTSTRSTARLSPRSSPGVLGGVDLVLVIALAALATTACTHVAPYDRGRLAHPTMTQSVGSAAADHLHAVQEGAAGGGSVAESGCGCN